MGVILRRGIKYLTRRSVEDPLANKETSFTLAGARSIARSESPVVSIVNSSGQSDVVLISGSNSVGKATAVSATGTTPAFDELAELPRTTPSLTKPSVTGSTLNVNNDFAGNLQAAINAAQPGDTIVLNEAQTYSGNFTFPNKNVSDADEYIIVKTSSNSIPARGVRATASDTFFATIRTANTGRAMTINSGARKIWFEGIKFDVAPLQTTNMNDIVRLDGTTASTTAALPREVGFDHCVVKAHANVNCRRGIIANCGEIVVVDSAIVEVTDTGGDAQAIAVWNGHGPFYYHNCEFSTTGTTIIWGGSPNQNAAMNPQDITVKHCYFHWDSAWKNSGYVVKNLFELKNAQRVLLEDFIIFNHWIEDQSYPINLKTESNNGWDGTQDVTVRYGIIRDCQSGMVISYHGDLPSNQGMNFARCSVHDIVYESCGADSTHNTGSTSQKAFLLSGPDDMTIKNVTCAPTLWSTSIELGLSGTGHQTNLLQLYDNIVGDGNFGEVRMGGAGVGTSALNAGAASWDVQGNAFITAPSGSYPANNQFPASRAAVDFADAANDDFTLNPTSPLIGTGVFNGDPGANIAEVNTRTSGVIAGIV